MSNAALGAAPLGFKRAGLKPPPSTTVPTFHARKTKSSRTLSTASNN